jgi:hypothetical protein
MVQEKRDSVCGKGVGIEKLEKGIGSSMLNISFMSVTQHCMTASGFVIFLCHSALVVIVTIIDCGSAGK